MPSPQLEYLVAQVESIFDCKISTIALTAILADYDAATESLTSDLEAIEQRLDILETPHIFIIQVENILACKIYTTTLNTQMSDIDDTLLAQESDLAQIESRMGVVEDALLRVQDA